MKQRTHLYMADFETTVEIQYRVEGRVRVWAWAIEEVDGHQKQYWGEKLEDFIDFFQGKRANIYFHNLKFDGSYLLDYWMGKGVTLGDKGDKEYIKTLIDGHGSWYMLEYHNEETKTHLWFKDLLKKYRMPLESIAKIFGIEGKAPLLLGYRPLNSEVTDQEWDRVLGDVRIGAVALRYQLVNMLTGLTVASDAMRSYKDFIGTDEYDRRHPKLGLDLDQILRKAYRGGWTFLNPMYKEIDVENVMIYDINSMYPAVMAGMHNERLPKGFPARREPNYQIREDQLEIVKVDLDLRLKKNALPWIHYKNCWGHTSEEYIIDEEAITLTLTTPDLELLELTYDTPRFEVLEKYVFSSEIGQFRDFVFHQNDIKIKAGKEGNGGKRQEAKDMMNTLSGKFALNPVASIKVPHFEDGQIKYSIEEDIRTALYCPTSCFITAHSRKRIVTDAMKFGPQFVYADTDSLHILVGDIDPEDILETDKYELGKYCKEDQYKRGRYLRAKAYYHDDGEGSEKLEVKCGGMPQCVKDTVTWDNFRIGNIFDGKLIGKVVPGGYVLSECKYKIQEKEGWR